VRTRLYLYSLFVSALHVACTPVPAPVTPPPDASDAAPAPAPLAGACAAACAAMQAAGCAVLPTCTATLTRDVDGEHRIRKPSGTPLTCADLAAVKTAADVQALGQPCGP
jgi:hypothetical protein